MDLSSIFAICFLVVLEGLLSFDNALALAAMVRHLPPQQRKQALTYGMWGAFAFRFLSLWFVTFLMSNPWVKLVGGGYLVLLAISHFKGVAEEGPDFKLPSAFSFWRTIILVELTDVAFSIDSILAAVAISKEFYVVLAGGVLGIITMRFVAGYFVSLIAKYPNLVTSAFGLVGLVGSKLIFEFFGYEFEHGFNAVIFWVTMLGILGSGFYRGSCGSSQKV